MTRVSHVHRYPDATCSTFWSTQFFVAIVIISIICHLIGLRLLFGISPYVSSIVIVVIIFINVIVFIFVIVLVTTIVIVRIAIVVILSSSSTLTIIANSHRRLHYSHHRFPFVKDFFFTLRSMWRAGTAPGLKQRSG